MPVSKGEHEGMWKQCCMRQSMTIRCARHYYYYVYLIAEIPKYCFERWSPLRAAERQSGIKIQIGALISTPYGGRRSQSKAVSLVSGYMVHYHLRSPLTRYRRLASGD